MISSCASNNIYVSFEDCEIEKTKDLNVSNVDWGGSQSTNISEPNSIEGAFGEIENYQKNNSIQKAQNVEISK